MTIGFEGGIDSGLSINTERTRLFIIGVGLISVIFAFDTGPGENKGEPAIKFGSLDVDGKVGLGEVGTCTVWISKFDVTAISTISNKRCKFKDPDILIFNSVNNCSNI